MDPSLFVFRRLFLRTLLGLLVIIFVFVPEPQSVLAERQGDTLTITLVEEFPTEANLAKLELIDFPVNIFIAAESTWEFSQIEERLKKYSNVELIGYWPVLKKEEGYWISAFSKRRAIERIIRELKGVNRPISVLWDAELPHLRRRLFLTELPRFLGNRRIIQDFIAAPPTEVTLHVAENRRRGILYQLVLKFFGVTFGPKLEYNRIEMLYGQWDSELLKKFLKTGEQLGGSYYPAFGLTAEGVGDRATEANWMLSPQKLDEQLSIAQDSGIKDVVIYRLGGLSEEYLEMIEKYVSN